MAEQFKSEPETPDLDAGPVWVFGYGSLIWKTGFDYAESRPAWVNGWVRRFWQGSTDHRGLPGAPGRVVTLVAQAGATCWGRAYRLDPEQATEVIDHLDWREKGGYERLLLPLHFSVAERVTGLVYHATVDNENFLGEASIDEIARQIANSRGPSGCNREYVFRLEAALAELGQADAHVAELADRLRELEAVSRFSSCG